MPPPSSLGSPSLCMLLPMVRAGLDCCVDRTLISLGLFDVVTLTLQSGDETVSLAG